MLLTILRIIIIVLCVLILKQKSISKFSKAVYTCVLVLTIVELALQVLSIL